MADTQFEKLTHSATPLYGSRKLLLCGFAAAAQPKFKTVLEMAAVTAAPLVWVNDSQVGLKLAELMTLPHDTGLGRDSELPRAVIVAGITQNELHGLMTVCRKTGMQQSLWAALTPTSESWTLQMLLAELQAERKALSHKTH